MLKTTCIRMLVCGASVLLAVTIGSAVSETETSSNCVANGLVNVEDGSLPLPSGAKKVFTEDFNAGGNATDQWDVVSGNWAIRDGALCGSNGALLVLKRELGSNLRVEYTAWSDDKSPCDLTAVLGSNGGLQPGCTFQFGGSLNSRNAICFNGTYLIVQEGGTFPGGIVKGKKHRIIAQNNGHDLVLFVDGKLLIQAHSFLAGPGALGTKAGFYIYTSGAIDDVTIYALQEDAGVPAWRRTRRQP